MAGKPTNGDAAELDRQVEKLFNEFGREAVLAAVNARSSERASRSRNPGRPADMAGKCLTVWAAVEIRRQRGPTLPPLRIKQTCEAISDDLSKLMTEAPLSAGRLRNLYREAARLLAEDATTRARMDAWCSAFAADISDGDKVLPCIISSIRDGSGYGPIFSTEAAKALGRRIRLITLT